MGVLIDKTVDSPYINFSEDGIIDIEGRSISEDVFSFWQPLLEWITEYCKKPAENTNVLINLEYTNSSSNKYINEILRRLEECFLNGNKVQITWKYEEDDESILQLGTDLEAMTKLPFKFEAFEIDKQRTQKVRIKSKKNGVEAIITYRYWDAIIRNGHGDEYLVIEELV
jgi:sugar-specific transcriptional regulator TrmB